MNCSLNDPGQADLNCEGPEAPGDSVATVGPQHACRKCGSKGRPVARKTVLLMLKPERLAQATSQGYRFCGTPECLVVYFDDEGHPRFYVDDLRLRVGVKMKSDPIPLCYCFGFYENDVRDEFARSGASTIPSRIKQLIKDGMCACDARNPAGLCCLGEVNVAVSRIATELEARYEP